MVMGETGDRAGDWSRDRDLDLDGEKNLLNAIGECYSCIQNMKLEVQVQEWLIYFETTRQLRFLRRQIT